MICYTSASTPHLIICHISTSTFHYLLCICQYTSWSVVHLLSPVCRSCLLLLTLSPARGSGVHHSPSFKPASPHANLFRWILGKSAVSIHLFYCGATNFNLGRFERLDFDCCVPSITALGFDLKVHHLDVSGNWRTFHYYHYYFSADFMYY